MSVRISKNRQITIPEELLAHFGMRPNDEVDIAVTARGLLIRRLPVEKDPVEQAYGIWGTGRNTDDYMEDVRGR